ncbi:hypothetical protein T440DRAFT_3956 [Plenodomus tracheiphilus IPT5]|uniref:Uncharacterized protein n=1 Tax=Plenodomus tracheiphilus IPT5 TaxID=1408161 RepID=A0A6A7BNZ5_9PLEO|nr:hypothetical protein T440DRAFT_3956 [Plenodomus tracheiphilus IPT5]
MQTNLPKDIQLQTPPQLARPLSHADMVSSKRAFHGRRILVTALHNIVILAYDSMHQSGLSIPPLFTTCSRLQEPHGKCALLNQRAIELSQDDLDLDRLRWDFKLQVSNQTIDGWTQFTKILTYIRKDQQTWESTPQYQGEPARPTIALKLRHSTSRDYGLKRKSRYAHYARHRR